MSAAAGAGVNLKADSWLIYRRLLRYAKPYTGVFLIGVLGAMLFAGSNASLVYLVKTFLNGAFVNPNPKILWEVPIGVVVLFTLRGIGDYVQTYYPSWVGRQVIKGLRRDVFSHYLRLPTAYLDQQQSGHLLSGAARVSVHHELAPRAFLHRGRAHHWLADENREPELSALQ